MRDTCCSLCSSAVTRATQSLSCVNCKALYHIECCKSEWYITSRTIRCCTPPQTLDTIALFSKSPHSTKRSASPLHSDDQRELKLICKSSPSADKMSEPPLWFAAFSTSLDAKLDAQAANINRIDSNIGRVEIKVDALQSEVRTECARLAALVERGLEATKKVEAELREIQRQRFESDSCEILLDDITFIHAVLDKIGLPNLKPFVLRHRPWLPQSAPASQATATHDGVSRGSTYRGTVFQMSSPTTRDMIVQNSYKLKDVGSASLFGSFVNTRISLRPLYPRNIHTLYAKACEAAKTLHFLRPIVKNMVVFMRPDASSDPIPINTPTDLSSLTPRQTP